MLRARCERPRRLPTAAYWYAGFLKCIALPKSLECRREQAVRVEQVARVLRALQGPQVLGTPALQGVAPLQGSGITSPNQGTKPE